MPRLWPSRRLTAAGLIASLAIGGFALAQETVIRVDVNLVRVLATVKDQNGALVGGLNRDDFEIHDNGAKQEIAVFERQTEQPLRFALLIDESGSTAKEKRYEIDAIQRFFKALLDSGNPDDSVAIFSFNYEVRKQNHFTRNIRTLEQSLKRLKPEAGTSLYDAIYLASEELEGRDGRKVILIVTDGGDTTSTYDFHKALEAAQLADAVIYSVLVVPIKNSAGRNVGGENALATLGMRTGGRVFVPSGGPALDEAFRNILDELRTQYLIGFYPKDVPLSKDRFHTLTVKTMNPNLRVSSRNGYYGETEPEYQSTPGTVTVRPRKSERKN